MERPPGSLAARLDGRLFWRSLWRRTDYLGFPVQSFCADAQSIDVPAEEVDQTGYLAEIVTHGNYPRSEAYLTVRELAAAREPVDDPG